MAISTNSIIHYTRGIENLKGILETGFKIKYCLENNYFGESYANAAFPMVSFCDIPLSMVSKHMSSYGYYGIGLTKEWAKTKGLNPVLYIEENSNIAKQIALQIKNAMKLRNDATEPDIKKTFELNYRNSIRVMAYCKNYEGKIIVGEEIIEKYRFYDEREWRYIPTDKELGKNKFFVSQDKYKENKDEFNRNVSSILLNFESEDIAYIIVKDDDEVVDIIKYIRGLYEDSISSSALQLLNTKIMSATRIINDF